MARQRNIVGIGEAVLCEFPDRIEPGGLALRVAMAAVRLGQIGVAISRVGQDQAGDTLLSQAKSAGVNVEHIQSDPDLPTGRLVVRSIGGKQTQSLTVRAAFDELRWDFDLVDVAQQADAVVFGELARREGQSRSIIKRFLAECPAAIRVFDLTNRVGDAIDRIAALGGLEDAVGVIVDNRALAVLSPGWDGVDPRGAAEAVFASGPLAFMVVASRAEGKERLAVYTPEGNWSAPREYGVEQHDDAIVGLTIGVLSGWDFAKCLDAAVRAAEHAVTTPTEPMSLT